MLRYSKSIVLDYLIYYWLMAYEHQSSPQRLQILKFNEGLKLHYLNLLQVFQLEYIQQTLILTCQINLNSLMLWYLLFDLNLQQ